MKTKKYSIWYWLALLYMFGGPLAGALWLYLTPRKPIPARQVFCDLPISTTKGTR